MRYDAYCRSHRTYSHRSVTMWHHSLIVVFIYSLTWFCILVILFCDELIGATEMSVGTEKIESSKEAHGMGDHKSKADNKTKRDSFYTSRGVTVLRGGVVPRPRAPSFSQATSRNRATSSGETTATAGSTPVRHPSSTTPRAPHVSTPTSPSSQWSPERTGQHPLLHPTHQSNLIQSASSTLPTHPSKQLIPLPPPNPTTTDPITAPSDGEQLLLFSSLLSGQWDEMEYLE